MTQRIEKVSRRRGFTLPEVLVTVSLVAILAAVVVPAIAGQIRKGDQSRIGNDMLAIRGGVEQFLSDVRRYPSDVTQLVTPITTTQSPLTGTGLGTYGKPDTLRWRGPYLSKDAASILGTGYGYSFKSTFFNQSLTANSAVPGSGAGYQAYLVLCLPMNPTGSTATTDASNALTIDQMFDDGDITNGVIRYISPGGGHADTLKFLVMPIY
ncbi:MAG TPA: prepilin-type N-terminal cleavage/methylation domain-containing protein [Gemmatimonadaceae bacterium]|nr:prepilin-type N-terminal cleavage/methylation domain-containing protein [Gemmatimonadaceae bacterium]